MTPTLTKAPPYFAAIAVVTAALFAAWSSTNSIVLGAALADVLITAPLVFYLVARRRDMSLRSAMPIIGLGIAALWFIAPPEAKTIPWPHLLIGLAELLLLGVLIWSIARAMRGENAAGQDALIQCEEIGRKVAGTTLMGAIIGAELSTLRYCLVAPKPLNGIVSFAPGTRAIIVAFICVSLIEMVAVHIIVHLFSPAIAWVLTGLTAYSVMTLIAHIRALPRRPHTLDYGAITLRSGLFSTCVISPEDIVKVAEIRASGPETLPEGTRFLSVLGFMEQSNIEITLRQPVVISHAYGIKRSAQVIRLFAAEPRHLFHDRRI